MSRCALLAAVLLFLLTAPFAPAKAATPTPPPPTATATPTATTAPKTSPSATPTVTPTTAPKSPTSPTVAESSIACGSPAPAATSASPCAAKEESVNAIEKSFPRAGADSSDDASTKLAKEVPQAHTTTRTLLHEKAPLPESGQRPWLLPGTDDAVGLDVTRQGQLGGGRAVGPGLREYTGGDQAARTVLQQLPGQSVRIYKVIDRHTAAPGAPTELSFRFQRACGRTCSQAWLLSDRYHYLGSRGITLIDPSRTSDIIAEGTPRGFLTAPAARDANGGPVSLTWEIRNGDTVEMRVDDGLAGVRYPVVVDPQWFIGRWLAKGSLLLAAPEVAVPLAAIGCGYGIAVDWQTTVGQVWYERVWRAALACLVAL
ncbi:hypothetical protein [Pseudonocardia acaciae]|uniref:hypothetical protein n=1 Tax=Pseudonocardia acaciae TaxID=551276 RepID=UPI0012ECFC5F|nr:hypothetical protein [Pseudonocardia acaciae]